MNKYIFLLVIILIFSVSLSAQTKQKRKSSHPAKDTILFEVLKDLADENVCGAKADSTETYFGTVLKRDFAEDELQLNGFVLRTAGDTRQYINLDSDHISGLAALASSDLRDWLIKGRKMKVFVYRCRRILYANRIEGL
ncbi:MAG: hypothetical protein M3388_15105 [Acidobacteriota bacterium]|nr:hypothetical protein [Acidobacteriota bacterium]